MSRAIYLNAAEMAALAGLPHLAALLYMLAIRPRMDYKTGLVGVNPRVSWHALTEDLYEEPHPGIKGGSPSVSALRRAAAWLVKAGLLAIQSDKDERSIVFECRKATTDKHAQNKADRKPTGQDAEQERLSGSYPQQSRHTPGNRVISLRTTTTSNRLAREEDQKGGPGGPVCDAVQKRAGPSPGLAERTETGRGTAAGGDDTKPQKAASRVAWAASLTTQQVQAIEEFAEGMEPHRLQLIADELAGAMAAREVRNPVGFARALVKRERRGFFTPELAIAIGEKRARIHQERAERPAAPPTPPDVARERLRAAKLEAGLQ